jgi:hypothetical protein
MLKDSPMCSMCGDDKELELDHIQSCQILTDATNNISDRDGWCKLSKLCCTARTKLGDIRLTGVG